MENQQIKGFYEFGEFRLDAPNRLLWRGDETVPLNLKEFEVLLFFVENAGRVVEKDALLNHVWKDTFIEEGTLTQNISRLRRKLEAVNPNGEKFIETLPKRGYRFLPAVVKSDENVFIIEEQTIQRIRIEEQIKISPPHGNGENIIIRETSIPESNLPPALSAQTSNLLPAAPAQNNFNRLWVVLGFLIVSAAAFGVYHFYFYNPEPKTIPVARVAPFSGLPGREAMPAFSPDGKQLVFTWNGGEEGDNMDVYVKLIGAGDPIRLTDNRADDVRPTFSPDGRTVAFVRMLPTRSEIYSIPALGGAERKIADVRRSFSNISFSPDGKFLAVHDGDETERAGIFLINVETGEKKRLTAPDNLEGDDQPMFSPDGQSIAFVRSFAQSVQEIFIVSPAGDRLRQLTFDKAWLGGIAWSADGKRILYVSRRKYNGQANLWQIQPSGSVAAEIIATGSSRLGDLAISPDGRTIAFAEQTSETNIWQIEPAKLPEREAFRKFASSSRNDNSPNVSPDDSQIVFASSRSGNYEIWISEAGGANARQVTDLKTFPAGSPRFSPDGKWIVFDAQVEGNGDIFIVPTNGGAIRRLTDSPAFDYIPAWSADGSSIYFASNRSGTAQLYKMPAAGGEARQITTAGGGESFESPDGKYLYYRKGGSAALWRVSTEGGAEETVAELAEAGYWRYWTMTKTGIYFVSRTERATYKIMFYDFSSGRSVKIAEVESAPVSVYSGLGATADGRKIFYVQDDQNTGSIMLAELGK